MSVVSPQKLKLNVGSANAVSALLLRPLVARACFIFAHGAGAGMTHQFMEQVATGLCGRGIATLRYQFQYMENESKQRNPPAIAHATLLRTHPCCRGQIIRRSHDLPGASDRAVGRRPGTCVPGISVASGGQAIER